jgi:hypothetical protein
MHIYAIISHFATKTWPPLLPEFFATCGDGWLEVTPLKGSLCLSGYDVYRLY